MRARSTPTLICALVLYTCIAPVRAQAPASDGPSLEWRAPSECPDAAAVRQRIVALLGSSTVAGDVRAQVVAVGVVTHGDAGYKLTLSVKGPQASGTRQLVGRDCAAMSDTAAWLVALTIDEHAPETPPEPPAPPTPTAGPAAPPLEPSPAPVAPPPATVSPVRPAASRWSLHAGTFAGVAQRHLPDEQLQLGGHVGVGYDFVQAELRAGYAPARKVDAGLSGGEAASSTQSYALVVCAMWGRRFRAGPCASMALRVTEATSRDVLNEGSAVAFWAAASLGGQAAVTLIDRLEVLAEGGLDGPVSARPAFTFGREQQRLIGPARVGYYAQLGVRFRWELSPRGAP